METSLYSIEPGEWILGSSNPFSLSDVALLKVLDSRGSQVLTGGVQRTNHFSIMFDNRLYVQDPLEVWVCLKPDYIVNYNHSEMVDNICVKIIEEVSKQMRETKIGTIFDKSSESGKWGNIYRFWPKVNNLDVNVSDKIIPWFNLMMEK